MNMIPRDINSTTEAEFYVTSGCMFIGLMINAFIIGSMASALNAMDLKKQLCREKLETIGLYLHVNDISPALRTRILEYYEYLFTSSQSFEDLNVARDLPPSLATRLAITAHRRLITRAPIFNSLSDFALLTVLKQLTPLIYVPGQVIHVEGQQLTQVGFIKKGRVQILRAMGAASEAVIRTLGANDNFGFEKHIMDEILGAQGSGTLSLPEANSSDATFANVPSSQPSPPPSPPHRRQFLSTGCLRASKSRGNAVAASCTDGSDGTDLATFVESSGAHTLRHSARTVTYW